MIDKLRKNYNLSKVLVRLLFVLAYVLYSWQTSLSVVTLMMDTVALGRFNVWIAVMSSALLGVILMLLVPLVCNVFLNYSRFYTVPRAEFSLLAYLFFALYFGVCGVLRLINLLTPLLIVWGEILFPVLVSLGCMIWFYVVTSNLYFNNQTKPYYFRSLTLAYFILIVIAEVLA